jgi:hypothetical protein
MHHEPHEEKWKEEENNRRPATCPAFDDRPPTIVS